MADKYQGTYNVKFLPFGCYNYGGPISRQCAVSRPINLKDVYLLNFSSYVSVFERKDGAKIMIPTESIVLMLPTEETKKPTLEVEEKVDEPTI